MAKVQTSEAFGSMFTTHPITGHESNGEPSALKAAFDSYDQAAADFESTVEDVAQSLDDIEAGKGKIKMSDKEWKKQNFKQRMKIIKSLGY